MAVSDGDRKFSTCFRMKYKTVLKDEHDIVHYSKCPEEFCLHDCVGESGTKLLEQVKDHNGTDTVSYIFKHFVATDHQFSFRDDLRTLGSNCQSNKRKLKIAEALLIKNLKSS